MKPKTMYMAYNHNGTELLREATTKAKAQRNSRTTLYTLRGERVTIGNYERLVQ